MASLSSVGLALVLPSFSDGGSEAALHRRDKFRLRQAMARQVMKTLTLISALLLMNSAIAATESLSPTALFALIISTYSIESQDLKTAPLSFCYMGYRLHLECSNRYWSRVSTRTALCGTLLHAWCYARRFCAV
jgi:hypothetical protein